MPNTIQDFGLYVPSTAIFDLDAISDVNLNSPEFRDILVRLYQNVNDINTALNLKDSGYFLTTEFNTSKLLFNTSNDFNNLRPIYRTVVNFGALPASGTTSVAHGISGIGSTYIFTSIITAATNPTTPSFIPVPYSSATSVVSNLEITVDSTNVNITTGGTDYSAYTTTLVFLEYVKFL
jgi:hypothetical protein